MSNKYLTEPKKQSAFYTRTKKTKERRVNATPYSNFGQTRVVGNEVYYAVYSGNGKDGDPSSVEIDTESETGDKYGRPPHLEGSAGTSPTPDPISLDPSNPAEIPSFVISPIWIGFFVGVVVFTLMGITTITLGGLTIDLANEIGTKYDIIQSNVKNNNINQGTACMSCNPSGDPDGSYTLTIESVMNNNLNSPTGFTQFSPNGITIDNILFIGQDSSSANSNTGILFENDLGASENLFASVPGYITVPISTLTAFQLTQFCSAFTTQILFSFYDSMSTSFNLCVCNSQYQKCINLV